MKEIHAVNRREWRAEFYFSFKNGSFTTYVYSGSFQNEIQFLNWRNNFLSAMVARCHKMRPTVRFFVAEDVEDFNREHAWEWRAWHDPNVAAIHFIASVIRSWIQISNAKDFK